MMWRIRFFRMFVRTNVRAWLDRDNHFVKLVVTRWMGIDAGTSFGVLRTA